MRVLRRLGGAGSQLHPRASLQPLTERLHAAGARRMMLGARSSNVPRPRGRHGDTGCQSGSPSLCKSAQAPGKRGFGRPTLFARSPEHPRCRPRSAGCVLEIAGHRACHELRVDDRRGQRSQVQVYTRPEGDSPNEFIILHLVQRDLGRASGGARVCFERRVRVLLSKVVRHRAERLGLEGDWTNLAGPQTAFTGRLSSTGCSIRISRSRLLPDWRTPPLKLYMPRPRCTAQQIVSPACPGMVP